MLRALRNQTQSIFFKGFLILLILGFALWGVGDLSGGFNKKPILSVDKKEITSEEILNELNRLRFTMPQRPSIQEAINNGMLKKVLDKYEQEILINSEADNLNLHVPLKIHTTTISKEKAFKDPLGKFSQSKFLKSLNNAGLSENKYLEMINTEANFKQLSMPFSNNQIYSDKVIEKLIKWQNEVRDVDYVFIKKIQEKNIKKPDQNILRKFYNKNKKSYSIPKTRDIEYIEIKPSNFNEQIKIDDKKIKKFYEAEKLKFTTEEKRKFYQVITQDVKKANAFFKEVKTGTDFINLAKNEFILTTDDINIGFVNKSELPSSVVKPLFQGSINDIVGPIKTKFGYSIYKIVAIKPQKIISYKVAYKDIKEEMMKELTLEFLYKKIDVIEDLIAEGNSLKEIVKNIGSKISIQKIKQISKNGIIYSYNSDNSFINKNKEFLEEVWSSPLNQISDIIDLSNDKYAFIETIKENKKETPNFNKINKTVYKQWLKKEVTKQTKLKLKELIEEKKVKYTSIFNIKRNQKNLTEKINDPLLINKIFDIKVKNLNFFNIQEGVIAIKYLKSKTADYKIVKKTVDNMNLSLSKSFFNDFSSSYLQILGNKHKIKRNYKDLEKFIGTMQTN